MLSTLKSDLLRLSAMTDSIKSYLLTGGILIGTAALLTPTLFWVYILASMYWTLHVQTASPEPWDGCADPVSQAELAQWIAHSEATGEPLCNPDVVNMTFAESE